MTIKHRVRAAAGTKPSSRVMRVGLAGVALLASACGSSSSTGSGTSATTGASGGSGNVAAGMAYFKGKTITMIAPDKPGGGFDNWARGTAPYMAQYLHATINIENIPAGNTIVGQNTMASSKADGLTIGWLNLVEDVSEKAAGVAGANFDPANLGIIGGTPAIPVVVLATPSSGIKSFDQLVSAPSVEAVSQTKGSTALLERVIFAGFGVKAKFISGYASSADLKAGFQRGDGQVAVDNISAFGPLIEGKAGVPLLVSPALPSSNTLASAVAGVPSEQEYAAQHPPAPAAAAALKAALAVYNFNATLAAPTGTPADEMAALRAAMQYGMQQPAAQAQLAKVHLQAGYGAPKDVIAAIQAGLANAASLKPYVPGG